MQHYDRVALPVVDSRGILVGIVTADDVADVAEEEATEDIQKMGGMEALDVPYLETGIRAAAAQARRLARRALFVGEMLTATAMGYFEREIETRGRAGAVHPADHLERRQLRLAGLLADHPRHGARRDRPAPVVAACCAARSPAAWCSARCSASIALLRIVFWPTRDTLYGEHYLLIASTVVAQPDRRRHLRHHRRLDAAVHPAPPRLRPGRRLGPVRRHAGRRHRPGDLLQLSRRSILRGTLL